VTPTDVERVPPTTTFPRHNSTPQTCSLYPAVSILASLSALHVVLYIVRGFTLLCRFHLSIHRTKHAPSIQSLPSAAHHLNPRHPLSLSDILFCSSYCPLNRTCFTVSCFLKVFCGFWVVNQQLEVGSHCTCDKDTICRSTKPGAFIHNTLQKDC